MNADEPTWLEEEAILFLQAEQLVEFGGMAGIRDVGLLASALGRLRNLWAYTTPKPDSIRIAASYTFGLAKNHPFLDGNKRIALIACHAFLRANGFVLDASQEEQVQSILGLAAGTIDEGQFVDWLRRRVRPNP